ncbi:MAG: hypothetical protein IJB90_05360 [Clostridia bacterium]|nr:hypothetical protein [Clostridia bacterium]
MLILVGVTINVALNGGLFEKAKIAKEGTEKQAIYDQIVAAMTITDNGKIDPLSTYNAVEKVLVAQGKTVTKTEETDSEIVFSVDGYTYTITENKITEGETDELGEYYLNLLNVAYGLVKATSEERNAARDELCELDDALLFENEAEKCCIIGKYYYYCLMSNPVIILLDENSNEYKKYNSIVNESLELVERVNELLIGYTYTEDNWSLEELATDIENNIENNIERNVDVNAKWWNELYLDIKSSIDETIVFDFGISSSKQNSTYIVESISYYAGIGF